MSTASSHSQGLRHNEQNGQGRDRSKSNEIGKTLLDCCMVLGTQRCASRSSVFTQCGVLSDASTELDRS